MQYMAKEYSIKNTTKEERQKIANEALAMSTIDAQEPSLETKKLIEKYINGEMEISEILEKTIARYKVSAN